MISFENKINKRQKRKKRTALMGKGRTIFGLVIG